MAWLAATFHDQLDSGTELAVFREPWDPEAVVPEQLPPSVELNVDFAGGAAAVVWVRDVIGTEAIIQTSDQTEWRMVLVEPKTLKLPPPPTEDAQPTYWRVKERVDIAQGPCLTAKSAAQEAQANAMEAALHYPYVRAKSSIL
jgi:hypothetical protein